MPSPTLSPNIPSPSEQLRLGLEALDVADPADDQNITTDMAQQISAAARAAFEDGAAGSLGKEWSKEYVELREQGWPWRVACYIAWAASPREGRWPTTLADLAHNVLGLRSDRVIRKWRAKNPAIDEAVAKMSAMQLFDARHAIIAALVESASNPDHKNHPDRKLALEMTGDYTPKANVILDREAQPFTADEMARAREQAAAAEAPDAF